MGKNTSCSYVTGQSTLELLIALGILLISIVAGIAVFFGGQSLIVDTQSSDEALYLARQSLEDARSLARNNFSAVTSSSSTQGRFLRELIVEDIDSQSKNVTSRVTWEITPLRQGKVELTTRLTNWRNVVPPPDPGDTGGGGLTGAWCNPRTLGSVDLGAGISATGIDVISKMVYMSGRASAESKPDFFIVNATDGQNPYVVSNLNTGVGLNAIDVAGNYPYAYVAQNKTTKQLQIIDISNRANPFLAAELTLPGVSGSGAVGWSIFYSGSKVYIGTKHATGPEFHVIDVSNPSAPSSLGSFEINADVNKIRVIGNRAYLAVSSNDELKILDISNPSSITQVGNYDAPGNSEDGKSLYLAGTRLYLARLLGGNHSDHHELHILDISNPASVQNLGSKNFLSDINDIVVVSNLAFLATGDSNREFQVWDVSDPTNITTCTDFNFPQVATGIDYEDNLVYVAVRSNDALRIITSQ